MTTPKTLTDQEVDTLLNHTLDLREVGSYWGKAVRNYTMLVLMVDTGIRVGELVWLKLYDLFFDGKPVKTLVVRSNISKNKTERTVPMSLRAGDALKLYNKEWTFTTHYGTSHFAFGDMARQSHLTTRQVERIVRKLAMESIGRPIHPHIFRHTFATRLMRVTDTRTVQELLGHKHIASTQIYTHPNENDKKIAIESMGKPGPEYEARARASAAADRVSD